MSATSLPIIRDILSGRADHVQIYKSGPGARALLARDLVAQGRDVVLIAADRQELATIKSLLKLVGAWDNPPELPLTESDWLLFPSLVDQITDQVAEARRMAALMALQRHAKHPPGHRKGLGLLISADNFITRWPSPPAIEKNFLLLGKGEEISMELLLEQAVMWGYVRTPFVTRPGEMAVRGDIIDIFSPAYDLPVRLEFFGDVIDDMRLFEVTGQRSMTGLEKCLLLPAGTMPATPELHEAALHYWEKKSSAGGLHPATKAELARCLEFDRAAIPIGLYYEQSVFIEDFLPSGAIRILSNPSALAEALKDAAANVEEYWLNAERSKLALPMPLIQRAPEAAMTKLEQGKRISFEELVIGVERQGIELPETPIRSFEEALGRDAAADYKERPWHSLLQALMDWREKRRQTILAFHSAQACKKFITLAAQDGLRIKTVYNPAEDGLFALESSIQKGLDLEWAGMVLLAEDILQPHGQVRRPVKAEPFAGLNSYSDLDPGDLLIHRDYGLGSFAGLSHMKVGESANDFLTIRYSGDDILYVPVYRLDLIKRYDNASDEDRPVLDRLGSSAWHKNREKARKAIEQIAHDLVEMYAYRKVAKGFSYGPLNEMYREFEVSFGFEETADQQRAIEDVLFDMEKAQPMDRLICGDVGFGKTEVAMRAAFRATLDGKQVAILCPTTILAEQHYQNFRNRMKDFPVNVAMLSRFVPAQQQKRIAAEAAKGQIDILIGTHRLLSQDIDLPNLGLLVLDEEQRFGVRQKERLKSIRKDVDVLTLTATPIPRTLQLSLSGIRDLSLIETPPAERKPVATAIIERDDAVLRDILQRELDRQGQIFWVYNRVHGLERALEYVSKLVPQARVAMAHGQMSERLLEDTMHRFWHGELDILVCTAIIESGLDFPRANTIVIDQAHHFGLAQLYQLRGRVGRSERQAFAYLVIPQTAALSETAERRLKILQDLDYLGAGFQVAQEDLRLRGAGNILGEVQSGTIAKIGLELFLDMLEEEVNKLKGSHRARLTEPELTIGFSAIIPESYINDARERLRYYKSLSSSISEETLSDITAEIYDRFGAPPEEFRNFLEVLSIKRILARLGVSRAELGRSRIKLSWSAEDLPPDPDRLIAWVAQNSGMASFSPPANLELRLEQNGAVREQLQTAGQKLIELLDEDKPNKL